MKIIHSPTILKYIILLCFPVVFFIPLNSLHAVHLNENVREYVSTNPHYQPVIVGIYSGEDTILVNSSEKLLENKLLHISYKNNKLTLVINSGTYTNQTIATVYSINNQNLNQIQLTSTGSLTLEELKEGNYKLYLKVLYDNGNFSKPLQLEFRILPPFYRTWWAYLIYSLFLFIIIFVLYKLYILKIHNIVDQNEGTANTFLQSSIVYDQKNANPYEDQYDTERKNKWDKFEMATVLFSDIQGFTRIAEEMNPELLIDELDKFFYHFDSVVDKYNIEKIKTIGDAYMAAGGIPLKNSTNPVDVVMAALEMQQFMKQLKTTKTDIWDLRIGIHTGPVIAGAIGAKKRSYDIWGDTVNTASRMESSGEPGKVNISGVTYSLVKEYFICEYRGKIPVKYKGSVDMYFVLGLRPELSVNLADIPNRKFFLRLQHLRLLDLYKYVFDKLKKELPDDMPFHNSEYASHRYEYANLISKAEALDLEETLIIKTASLFISLGYTGNQQNPETRAARLAREILPEFKYPEIQINTISNILLASKWPPEAFTLLEKIMIDIRMEYLGRADYIKLQNLLYLETNKYVQAIEPGDWIDEQISLLQEHEFLTLGAKRLREIASLEQIRKLNKSKSG